MKKIITLILACVLIVACITISVVLINSGDRMAENSSSNFTSNLESVSFSKLIESSNSILTASVISSSTSGDETVYTISVSEMLKGKNITGLGHLHVKNKVPIDIGTKIIIFSNSDKKYNYKEPFLDAPFVLIVDEGGKLTQINGIGKTVITDIKNGHIDFIRHNVQN